MSTGTQMMRASQPGLRRDQISVLLTAAALLLGSHSMIFAKLEIGFFGLIHGLPLTFFIGLCFLTIASALLWTTRGTHNALLLIQLLILIAALSLIPSITGGSAPLIKMMCHNLALTNLVTQRGAVHAQEVWYLGYPGLFILSSVLGQAAALDFEPLLNLIPFFMQLLYLLPLYVVLRNLLGAAKTGYYWTGCWLLYLALWLTNDYFSPQFLAFFYFLTLLALATGPLTWREDHRATANLSAAAVIFAALAVTHLLTALGALLSSAALALVNKSRKLAIMAAVGALLVISWDLTGGWNYSNQTLHMPLVATLTEREHSHPLPEVTEGVPIPPEITEGVPIPPEITEGLPIPPESPRPGEVSAKPGILRLDPELIFESDVGSRLGGSPSHRAVARIRILYSALFAFLAVAGLTYTGLRKKGLRRVVVVLSVAAAPIPLLFLGGPYGGELLQRVYLLTLPAIACSGAFLLDTPRKVSLTTLCVIMLLALPLHVASRYGNQELDYFSKQHIVATDFFEAYTRAGYLTGSADRWDKTLYTQQYVNIPLRQALAGRAKLAPPGKEAIQPVHYIYIGRWEKAYYGFFLGDEAFIPAAVQYLNSSSQYALIYTNGQSQLWVREL